MCDESPRQVGRPPLGMERIRCTVNRVTLAKLNRLAKKWGFQKRNGSPSSIGRVVEKILETVETEEPEYLKLAREANSVDRKLV